ncbi:hypothetical protein C4J81_06675 [Deltaproteobacteria bacterium Smac51]|nr:hypothetical protein C4J81_06675 [Deltaproteobacteria bacterium Smac51]
MSKENRVEVWLNRALEIENRGRDFYLDVSKRAGDAVVGDFFKMLADQELLHIKIIKDIYNKLGDGNSCWLAGKGNAEPSGLNELFRKVTSDRPSAEAGILEAIDNGMKFENEAREYYEKELPQATCAEEKDFLTRLAAEESGHYQMLSDMKLYYTDPEAWNDQQDNMHLDGV